MTAALIIAVDGPAASGKGTIAARLARTFGLPHLDTGLLYRAVGLGVVEAGGSLDDAVTAEAVARALDASHLILGLAAGAAVSVDEPGMIATSFPGFVELMRGLGAEIAWGER